MAPNGNPITVHTLTSVPSRAFLHVATQQLFTQTLAKLYFLASSPNHVFTREQLLDQIWGYEYIGDTRTVDVHIKRLREKIKDHANWKISTIWGIGYKFEVRN
jgi:DNA-binding response OmpR family regulator